MELEDKHVAVKMRNIFPLESQGSCLLAIVNSFGI